MDLWCPARLISKNAAAPGLLFMCFCRGQDYSQEVAFAGNYLPGISISSEHAHVNDQTSTSNPEDMGGEARCGRRFPGQEAT
jgi:hypothetical protein